MEQKTAEEFLVIACGLEDTTNPKEYCNSSVYWEHALQAMQAYAKQQQEIAVEKALEMASDGLKQTAGQWNSDFSGQKQSILSLKPEILKELNK